jgi:hypothetical protein
MLTGTEKGERLDAEMHSINLFSDADIGSGTDLVMDELASSDTIKDQTEKPSLIIPGVPQTRVLLITTWSSCWIAGALF